jgi:hypothetical protein
MDQTIFIVQILKNFWILICHYLKHCLLNIITNCSMGPGNYSF